MCRILLSASVWLGIFSVSVSFKISNQISSPRVCVIGAGIAGLTSAKHLKDEGINFKVLEATRYVGGTWRYDHRVDTDENGLPLFTSMYKELRTNLPKPTMELKGFPIPKDMKSYPSGKNYYNYIESYAKHFDLQKHIEKWDVTLRKGVSAESLIYDVNLNIQPHPQFLHLVTQVRRENGVWKVNHRHAKTGEEFEEEFDFVLVANGHFSKPNRPIFPGEDLFQGSIIHSHSFKESEPYKDRRVLIVGAGPSGMDINMHVAKVATTLVHSYHSVIDFKTKFPANYVRKPDIKKFNETGAIFVDGSYEKLDDVILCTGYEFNFPFLDKSCQLRIEPRSVVPLYQHMVNIKEPTMILLGLVSRACLVVSLDAQSRYATALIKGNFTLPSEEVMMNQWQKHADHLKAKGRPPSEIHLLSRYEDQYYEDLTKESGIERVPPVMYSIRATDMLAKIEDLYKYRDYEYTVIDKERFVRTLEEPSRENTTSCSP